MQDMDVQHQLTLIDELVTSEHIDGLALMPLANTLVRDRINDTERANGHPGRDASARDIADANRIAYCRARTTSPRGRAAAALLGMVMQGHGSAPPILGQRSGTLRGFAAIFTGFWRGNGGEFPGYPRVSAPSNVRSWMKSLAQ